MPITMTTATSSLATNSLENLDLLVPCGNDADEDLLAQVLDDECRAAWLVATGNFELIDGSPLGVLVEVVVAVYSFVGIAMVADEHLATSLETLCARWDLPEDVAGASLRSLINYL